MVKPPHVAYCLTQVIVEKEDIEGINDAYWQLRAEAIPEDQLSIPEQDRLIPLYHFSCDQQSTVSWLPPPCCP